MKQPIAGAGSGRADTVGLYGPVYVAAALVMEAQAEIGRLAIRQALGDKIGALETLGYLLLKAAGKAPIAGAGEI